MAAVPDFNAANDPDTLETQEWLEALETVLEREGPERAHYLLEKLIDKARRSGAHIPYNPNTAYINTIPPHMEARSPGDAALEERIRSLLPLERDGDGRAREQGRRRPRRPHRELRLARHADRHRAAPLLACADRRPRRRPDLLPGPLGAGRLRADDPRGPAHRGAGAQLPARGRRQGHLLVSASLAHARRLAVPDGVDGPRADPGDLPGALPQVPARARAGEDRGPQGLGVHRRRRDRRARVARRDRHRLAREARQPDLRHQLQPAASRRPGARQRQDHPGARGRVPRRGLERDQARLGLVLGSAPRARPGRHSPAA